MRLPRIKPAQTDTFMHVYNRIAGPVRDFPFDKAEKEQFIRRVHQLTKLYVIEIIAYQVMGNHFHLLVYVPSTPPSAEEAARRYANYRRVGSYMDNRQNACVTVR
ncbi:MAG: hypothetical protein WCL16_12615, partial [bacterium]